MNTLTICFPVYNEVKFIDSLIQSVIGTFLQDKQIVLMDGGSKTAPFKEQYTGLIFQGTDARHYSSTKD